MGREGNRADLAGKVAVVTGGTQGLGEAVARLFAARGAAGLVICGRNAERGERVAAEIGREGCRTIYVRADLAEMADVRRICAAADAQFGRVDALVNAAGITDRGTLFDTSPELFDRMFAVNVRAPFFLMQDAAAIMRREGIAGAMVNILSMSAHGGQPFITAYCGSKGALATLTRNAAFSLMPWRIRVNGLNIGWTATPGEDRIMRLNHGATDGWLERAAAHQPFGRLIDPDEVARACAYLCSEESGLMTGALIDFDQSVLGCYESTPHPSAPAEGAA
ncbi:SDR family oxidoreductase [Salinarimonas soli]|uniref:SDR family oxidoreductase n=1 Tax=Salinarimonas soli TaxID=1638099 RepID=A0A5B2V8A2_9HYPH|nr:SDR family oxidoreductase [Salinarimonas soli]KAA2234662.1 SDR family oxidoreductase [Salinarimonas soli]